MRNRFKIRVFGRVQGVFFRANAKTLAQELVLSGWVRNEPDGSVGIEVEGDVTALSKFLVWCKQGTRYAKVERIESQEIPCEHSQNFRIL